MVDISKFLQPTEQLSDTPASRLMKHIGDASALQGAAARAAHMADGALQARTAIEAIERQSFGAIAQFQAAGSLAEAARMTEWSREFSQLTSARIADIFGPTPSVVQEMARLQSRIQEAFAPLRAIGEQAKFATGSLALAAGGALVSERLALASGPLVTTHLKVAAFAEATSLLRPGALASKVAFESLLGSYRTRIDLPQSFWRHREVRREVYREAEVDQGLVEAKPTDVVEIFIDSGIAEAGRQQGARAVAVLNLGPVEVHVAASQPKVGAFRVIDTFEVYLREFVACRLEAVAGIEWLKHRAPGDLLLATKTRRKEALRRGESFAPLHHFLHLGEVCSIILRRDNWDALFGEVFRRRERLQVDIERLIGIRNPTMHPRSIDAVQLLEVVATTVRLRKDIDRDGPIDADWEQDW
ncbi:hypothetical protein GRZ55_10870 [Chelativorans sp. ZYF759]|uniref:hypothetical protein n=1 Tax=Chelativorans sp. ZYF759 TaxID=2692213 RepID=UPI00145C98FA|nr:hypothetical protein [Chelativorans sp. ZYF759]NMG39744.1 hypothetical protein [Chelativorans sp. ZYF759]